MLFTTTSAESDIWEILAIQHDNLGVHLSPEVRERQGFVTVKHSFEVLNRMNTIYPSIIAKTSVDGDGGVVAGYCLMMPREFVKDLPILRPLIDRLMQISHRGIPLSENPRWFIMGQVAVADVYRGQGLVDGMYRKMAAVYKDRFDFIVTEVAASNGRSLRAHRKVGFQDLLVYENQKTGDTWHIIVWDIC